ncbi:hypothetical protein [Vulcanisaeta distributa]|uniref:hypothetical protein n=1 Tax=Vulcanisaeta distributa TaxID=164451 RepID=UPI000B1BE5C0|nr:hypothetical protein [Vulcanisaeta distributa]
MVLIEALNNQGSLARENNESLIRLLKHEGIEYKELEYADLNQWPLPPRLITDGINIDPEPPGRLFITDTTFRDGQQAFYVYYSINDAVKLFRLLADLDNGSGKIIRSEFFLYTGRDRELVKAVRDLGLEWPRVIGWGGQG